MVAGLVRMALMLLELLALPVDGIMLKPPIGLIPLRLTPVLYLADGIPLVAGKTERYTTTDRSMDMNGKGCREGSTR